ncbi:MAG: hypothetical protein WCT43_01245 [Candidatus Magasanikbacteria bacterium]|jgi:hypothetical protein
MLTKFKRQDLILYILTLVAWLLPFIIYWFESYYIFLPPESVWYANGINHGPWRSQIENFIIYYPLLILVGVNIILTVNELRQYNKIKSALVGSLLFLMQVIMIFVQFYYLGWLID